MPSKYSSPSLKTLDVKVRPINSPACATCPASLWFSTSEEVKCYCHQMHLIVWDDKAAPVQNCDGRELAILKMLAREAAEKKAQD